MQIQDLLHSFEEIAPLHYAESFDNVGLLVGNPKSEIQGVLITLDTLEAVIDEAVEKNCNLIISFHPIIFSGLKKLTGKSYVERTVQKAIRHNIAIFAIHTALDNSRFGVNKMLCDALGLENQKILLPKKETIKKLTTFVPKAEAETLREALFKNGAGNIGNYANCSFNIEGKGSFKPTTGTNPTIGTINQTHYEEETQIGITFPAHLENQVLQALFDNHSYEEVAYEVTTLENTNQNIGMGMLAEIPEPMEEKAFLAHVKKILNTGCIRHSNLLGRKVKTIAVLGGSGSFAIEQAKRKKADIFLTGDLKYHDFFKAENRIILADIGHYESEQFTKNGILEFISKKITNFAPALPKSRVMISEVNTNPIKYL